MSNLLTIQIPFDLARYATRQRSLVTKYETNAIIKALDTWLVLKAESRSSWLQRWNFQKQHLFTICKVSETIFRLRIKMLKEMQLLTYDRDSIRLCSWDQLQTALQCDISKKLILQYDIHDSQTITQWIIAAEIKDNQNRQAYKVMQKLNKNPVFGEAVINAAIAQGADKSKLNNCDYLFSWLRIMYVSDFVQVSDIHNVLTEIRPDTNRGVRGISKAWTNVDSDHADYAHKVKKNVCRIVYWKKKLQAAGIIDISKLQVESTTRTRNRECHVLWLPACKNSPRKHSKQTMLCLCDNIELLTPWLYKELPKSLAA